eukprot:542729-Rhodomonas_salina.2
MRYGRGGQVGGRERVKGELKDCWEEEEEEEEKEEKEVCVCMYIYGERVSTLTIVLCTGYAMSGTEMGYAATRCLVLRQCMLLCDVRYKDSVCCYVICGTEIGYAAMRCTEERGRKTGLTPEAEKRESDRYQPTISCYAFPTRCPVLKFCTMHLHRYCYASAPVLTWVVLPAEWPVLTFRLYCLWSCGTEVRYAATRLREGYYAMKRSKEWKDKWEVATSTNTSRISYLSTTSLSTTADAQYHKQYSLCQYWPSPTETSGRSHLVPPYARATPCPVLA